MIDYHKVSTVLFRCSFCSELIPTNGRVSDLEESLVMLKKPDGCVDDLDWHWEVKCHLCEGNEVKLRNPFTITEINHHYRNHVVIFNLADVRTLSDLRERVLDKDEVSAFYRSELMWLAHFMGDRPEI
jgi:hypothetical protein